MKIFAAIIVPWKQTAAVEIEWTLHRKTQKVRFFWTYRELFENFNVTKQPYTAQYVNINSSGVKADLNPNNWFKIIPELSPFYFPLKN